MNAMKTAMRTTAISLALACGLALFGCGTPSQTSSTADEAQQQSPAESASAQNKNASPEEILDEITADFEATEKTIADSLAATKTAAGNTYESYKGNKDSVANWYEATQKATDDLFARTEENSKRYFLALAEKGQAEDSRYLDDGMKAWYRTVYEDAFRGFYQEVYEDDFKELYETYYDGALKEAYGAVNYSELSDESSSFYRQYSDGMKNLYRSYSDAMSDNYRMYSDVSGEFYKKNYDLSNTLTD